MPESLRYHSWAKTFGSMPLSLNAIVERERKMEQLERRQQARLERQSQEERAETER